MASQVAAYEFAGVVSRAVRVVTDAITDIERRRAAFKTRQILATLTDEQLADIGVMRANITHFS